MTERKPTGIGFESWIDRQIREATDRGEFDNLPGTGKPIPGQGQPDDEDWWIKDYLRREGLPTETLLPLPLRLRAEVQRLPSTVAGLHTEAEVRDAVESLNRTIKHWLLAPSEPRVHLLPVKVDDVLEQWRAVRTQTAGRQAGATPAVTAPAAPQPPPRAPRRRRWRWWRRWRRWLSR